MNASEKTMDKIVNLCKGRGYVYPSSEIYGGLSNSWDFGPLGAELKTNVKRAWRTKFVQENPYNVGLDSAILMNSQVWVASGHVVNFNDPLIDCKGCKMRHRADKLIEDWLSENPIEGVVVEAMTNDDMVEFINEKKIPCPGCGKTDFTGIRKFNLMFKTHIGVTEDNTTEVYLRPETAQGIFVNFNNVQRTTRRKIPFGICQIGKSFRNEITPKNFIFRVREFEQMELEFFCEPDTDLEWFDYWRAYCRKWLTDLGMKDEFLRLRVKHQRQKLIGLHDLPHRRSNSLFPPRFYLLRRKRTQRLAATERVKNKRKDLMLIRKPQQLVPVLSRQLGIFRLLAAHGCPQGKQQCMLRGAHPSSSTTIKSPFLQSSASNLSTTFFTFSSGWRVKS